MANLSITAANVKLAGSGVSLQVVQVGEDVDQGEVGYLKTSDSKYWLAVATSAAAANAKGIFLTPASANGYAVMAMPGSLLNLGATLVVGEVYCVSATAGKICPHDDLVSTNSVTTLFVPTAASSAKLKIDASGSQIT